MISSLCFRKASSESPLKRLTGKEIKPEEFKVTVHGLMHAQKKWLRTELGVVVPIGAPVPLETTSGSFAGVSLAGGAASNGVSTTSGLP